MWDGGSKLEETETCGKKKTFYERERPINHSREEKIVVQTEMEQQNYQRALETKIMQKL